MLGPMVRVWYGNRPHSSPPSVPDGQASWIVVAVLSAETTDPTIDWVS